MTTNAPPASRITLPAVVIGVLIIAAHFYWVTVAVRSQFPMAAFMPFVAFEVGIGHEKLLRALW